MLRRLLTILALVALLGLAACGDDEEADGGGGGGETAQEETGTETTSPAEAAEALKDTSTRPAIPRPSGSPPRRLVTEDIVKGTGAPAKAGDQILVHYVGMNFSNGQEFDASWDTGSPFPLEIGAGQVIEGWDRGLVGIRKGGRRMLTIPPELGYGPSGAPPDIPPNETLVFVVDAVSVEN